MFDFIRLFIGILLLALTLFFICRTSSKHKRRLVILTVVALFALLTISGMLPPENLFVTFESPESALRYHQNDTAELVLYGEESCMVIYKTKGNTWTHAFYPKDENGYKLPTWLISQRVAYRFDAEATIQVYRIKGTEDHYVSASLSSPDILAFDENGEQIEVEIVRHEFEGSEYFDRGSYYFYLPSFSDGYYLTVGGEIIQMAED